jgi:hypothetical protein
MGLDPIMMSRQAAMLSKPTGEWNDISKNAQAEGNKEARDISSHRSSQINMPKMI